MKNYSISGRTIEINGHRINFQYEIKNTVEFDDLIIVIIWNLATGDIQKQPFNNVYAIDRNGNILWNIKDIIGKDGLYTIIRVDESSYLVAVEFIRVNYVVDVKNRKIVGGRAYR